MVILLKLLRRNGMKHKFSVLSYLDQLAYDWFINISYKYKVWQIFWVSSWSFLKDPSPYLEPGSGLLNFPVLVTTQTGESPVAPPLELRVLALVAPPCPITVTPPSLDLGNVTTQETVCSDLHLTNHHHSCTYHFAFLDLPQVPYCTYITLQQPLQQSTFLFETKISFGCTRVKF